MQIYQVEKNTLVNVVVLNDRMEIVKDEDIRARISHSFLEYEILADLDGFKNRRIQEFPTKTVVKMARMARLGCTSFLLSPHNSAAFLGYSIDERNEAAFVIVPNQSLQEKDES